MTAITLDSSLRGLLYTAPGPRYVALFLHGGCFQDGDETWNAEQCKELSEGTQGVLLTLNFRQSSPSELLADCRVGLKYLRETYPSFPLGVYGGSSGGYYALELSTTESTLSFCVAICPVARPLARFDYLTDTPLLKLEVREAMARKQLRHFGDLSRMRPALLSVSVPTLVIAGADDLNVPLVQLHMYNPKVVEGAGHVLAYKPSPIVVRLVQEFLQQVLV